MAAYKDPKPLFKRLIKAAQRPAEHPRRSENNYFQLLLRTIAVSPWIEYRVPDQNIATAAEFAHKLVEAANFQDFVRIETAFIQRILSSKDAARMATEPTADPVKTISIVPDGVTHAPLLPT